MILADYLPQSNILLTSDTMIRTVIVDESNVLPTVSSDSTAIDNTPSSITPIKIPLVSFEPILATSPNYILVNEFTKRRNQLVLFDDHLQKLFIRSPINKPLLDALWYDNQQMFLLLTSTNIFGYDPKINKIELLNEIIPVENKAFKCFSFLNESTLLIAYDEWGAEYVDKWEEEQNGLWKLVERKELKLTLNEFIGNMLVMIEEDCSNIGITIYNAFTEQWRMEIRNAETLICHKSILLPGSNVIHDYKMTFINNKNLQSDIKWLVFSSTNTFIIAFDPKWKKIRLNYKYPVQRMAQFRENYLIVRTTERVDIHSFM